jgi:hypothetical protein
LIDVNELLKASVENKFQKYVKDNAIMHLLYDDKLKNTLEEDTHNIIIDQNDIKV